MQWWEWEACIVYRDPDQQLVLWKSYSEKWVEGGRTASPISPRELSETFFTFITIGVTHLSDGQMGRDSRWRNSSEGHTWFRSFQLHSLIIFSSQTFFLSLCNILFLRTKHAVALVWTASLRRSSSSNSNCIVSVMNDPGSSINMVSECVGSECLWLIHYDVLQCCWHVKGLDLVVTAYFNLLFLRF